jgi:hypothetical protein
MQYDFEDIVTIVQASQSKTMKGKPLYGVVRFLATKLKKD